MTTMTGNGEVLKQDARSRVRVPVARREALLDEFENSGLSGAGFARLAGIKYATFAGWVHKRRKARAMGAPASPQHGVNAPVAGGGALRLFEAVVEGAAAPRDQAVDARGLLIELPGGSRTWVGSAAQLGIAAQLVALIAQSSARTRC